jgi:hypothetical protein
MNGKQLEPVRANSIVAPDCPLTAADLAGVRVVRSQMLNGGWRNCAAADYLAGALRINGRALHRHVDPIPAARMTTPSASSGRDAVDC